MKRTVAATAGLALVIVSSPAAQAAEPYDAPTLAMGGSYVTRYSDINSSYWNPADLHHVRGYFYLGPTLGMLVGTDAGTFNDVLGLQANPATGRFGALVNYLEQTREYSAKVTAALKNGTDPGEPPTVGQLDLPPAVSAYLRADTGIAGLNIPYSKDNAFGWRSYLRADVTPFLAAPQASSLITSVLQGDHDLAKELLVLRTDLTNGDFGSFGPEIDHLKGILDTTLGPLAKGNGASFALGAEANGYLVNAFSYQMPLPGRVNLFGPYQAKSPVQLGGTVKIFSGLGALGLNQMASSYLAASFPNSAIPVGVPGRYEIINTINLSRPLADLYSALDSFKANPASGSAALTDAASGITKGYSLDLVSHVAGPVGVGLDFGAIVPLKNGLRVGAVLQNFPQTLWPGQKSILHGTLTGAASGSASSSNPLSGTGVNFSAPTSTFENFTYSEPTAVRLGAGWDGPLGLSLSTEVGEAFDGPDSNPFRANRPSLHLGLQESLLNVVYLRLGTQLGGSGSLLGAGAGLNLGIARLDLGGGFDYGLNAFSAATSLTLGI